MNTTYSIVFFDGVCNLCNSSVQFILKRDTKNKFKYASLQSSFALNFFANHNYIPTSNSIILFHKEIFYNQSTAVLKIARNLGFPTTIISIGIIIPKIMRDKLYRWVSANRYKWFGKRDFCMIPSINQKEKFLDTV